MKDRLELNKNQEILEDILLRTNVKKLSALGEFLRDRIDNPESFVVFLGETSSGKSTIINGLLGKAAIPVSAAPTTASLIEVVGSDENKELTYFALNKDATIEKIDQALFQTLSTTVDDQLQRLRIESPAFRYGLKGLRIFDTPGYGSLFEEHDRVLKEFIPESDAIVYVISYRVGMKENDHQFLSFVTELVQDDTNITLVINRCPAGTDKSDKRIVEILEHVQDCLHRKVKCFIIDTVPSELNVLSKEESFPQCIELWKEISGLVNSEERSEKIEYTLLGYQRDLLLNCKTEIEKVLMNAQLSNDNRKQLEAIVEEFSRKREPIQSEIELDFGNLQKSVDKMFLQAGVDIAAELKAEINATNKWTSKDECTAFVNNHLLSLSIKKNTKVIVEYFQDELDRLNEKIEDMLNAAFKNFETEISVKLPILQQFVEGVAFRIGNNLLENGLMTFFAQFGGQGGAGAGVANAAKKGLKKFGSLFGKTFSRDTHNSVAQFLKKIGATSTKAITAAAAILIEAVFYIYDSVTWQSKLSGAVTKAVKAWSTETINMVKIDLKELEDHNHAMVDKYFQEFIDSSTMDNNPQKEHETKQYEILLNDVNAAIETLEKYFV
jgi:GTP-binding protein EngB required for normal cell division